ncbi:MAG: ABC transporter substrate-binding protein [Burkholderiales bacterium]
MNRRESLLGLFALGATNYPLASFAQQPNKVWRVGFLGIRAVPPSPNPDAAIMAFFQGLRDLGWVEGKNLSMVWRSSDGNNERLPVLAAELVQLNVDVIVSQGSPGLRAAQQATESIPIVFVGVGDPVALGFVASLARPGKNSTGASNQAGDLSIKSLEFLGEVVPKLSRVAVLMNPTNPVAHLALSQTQVAAKPAKIGITAFEASSASQIEAAFAAITRSRPQALIVAPDPFYVGQARLIADLAAKARLPAIYSFNPHAEAGGLMSYGENTDANFRRGAGYVDKILKGAKPADLPVEQPTRFELVINMKTAKALGLKVPQSMMLRADRVIE